MRQAPRLRAPRRKVKVQKKNIAKRRVAPVAKAQQPRVAKAQQVQVQAQPKPVTGKAIRGPQTPVSYGPGGGPLSGTF